MPAFHPRFFNFSCVLSVASICICVCSLPGQQGALPVVQGPENSIQVTAADGEPFGVFSLKVPIAQNLPANPRVLVHDSENRVFYPVVSVQTVTVRDERQIRDGRQRRQGRIGRPGGLIDRLRGAIQQGEEREEPVALEIRGLYRGNGPLTVVLSGDLKQEFAIAPSVQSLIPGSDHRTLMNDWWKQYTTKATQMIQQEDFPKLVHQYLVSMLARRLDLPNVDLTPEDPDEEESNRTLDMLALLAAIEPLRDDVLEQVMNLPMSIDASNALPPEILWPPMDIMAPIVEPEIETIASRVPPECFYLRFGAFTNFVWFQDIAERYGGDMAQAVLLRGFNYEATARMERMLAAKMTQLAKMFGDKLVGDMALVGSDLYMKEGASLGVIFYAKNPALLKTAIRADRSSVAKNTPGATVQDLEILGRQVQLLSTPDNQVRSFYVSDGDYIFVTSSRALVRRFLEVGEGGQSLAGSPHFRWTRSAMPDANDYSVFAYFSPEFFHQLVSPQYQIELRRRLQAIAHLEMAEMATQAARSEGFVPESIAELKNAGLLPAWFDERPDQAVTLRTEERWIDSMRGRRGSFTPIPDLEIQAVTAQELAAYQEVAEFYSTQWQQMDPMVVGLRRFAADDGSDRETVAFEGYIAPFEKDKYGWVANLLGQPTAVELGLPQDDMATLQVHMAGNQGIGPKSGNYHLFAGVKDMVPPNPEDTKGLIATLRALQATPAYIGAWPKPQIVEQLPLGIGRQLGNSDIYGFSRMIGGLWRWQSDTFSLLSFSREIIEAAIPQLSVNEATDFAQARLKVVPLSGTQLGAWVNNLWYQRGWKSSHANTRLLDEVHLQLRVPADECMDVTQKLLDVKLQCPLGGSYEFVPAGQVGWWQSSAWADSAYDDRGKPAAPPTYSAPWIDWFRGGRAHLTQGENSLALVGAIDLEMKPIPPELKSAEPANLPSLNFDVFSLPMQIFGNGKKVDESKAGQPQRRSF